MNIVLDNYTPLISYLSPASIPQIVAHIQDYLLKHPILSVETVAEIIVQSLQEHPELLNGEAIPISADSEQSIKAYIDALPFLDTYTKAEINALLLGKQDTLTFDQAPTPGSSNPVTSSGIIAALSALQSALETQIGLKADSASTYTKSQVDTLLEDKADADNVYSKNTIDAKLLEVDTEIDNVNDALDEQSQQIGNVPLPTTAQTITGAIAEQNRQIDDLEGFTESNVVQYNENNVSIVQGAANVNLANFKIMYSAKRMHITGVIVLTSPLNAVNVQVDIPNPLNTNFPNDYTSSGFAIRENNDGTFKAFNGLSFVAQSTSIIRVIERSFVARQASDQCTFLMDSIINLA